MKLMLAMGVVGAMVLAACDQPVARIQVPGPEDQSTYRPVLPEKPNPPDGYMPGQPSQPGQPMPPAQAPPGNQPQ